MLGRLKDGHTREEHKEKVQKYLLIPLSEKTGINRKHNWVYNWKTKEWIKTPNYKYMPKYRVDNMNPVTNGINYSASRGSSYPKERVPSKKHKNRYKNFLKMFPDYEQDTFR